MKYDYFTNRAGQRTIMLPPPETWEEAYELMKGLEMAFFMLPGTNPASPDPLKDAKWGATWNCPQYYTIDARKKGEEYPPVDFPEMQGIAIYVSLRNTEQYAAAFSEKFTVVMGPEPGKWFTPHCEYIKRVALKKGTLLENGDTSLSRLNYWRARNDIGSISSSWAAAQGKVNKDTVLIGKD